jgi:hypothetical protein
MQRRHFVTTLIGAPVAAAGASLLISRARPVQASVAEQMANDPLHHELMQQAARASKDLTEGKHREGMRALELVYRFQAAHGRQQKLDDLLKKELKKSIQSKGRQQLHIDAGKAYDKQQSEFSKSTKGVWAAQQFSDEHLTKVVARIESTGYTPFLIDVADAMSKLEGNHHKNTVKSPAIAPVSSKLIRDWEDLPLCSDCEYLQSVADDLSYAAVIVCVFAPWGPCAGATAGWLYAVYVKRQTCDGGCKDGKGDL